MSLRKWVAAVVKVGRRLQIIIHAPRRIALLKSHVLNTTQTGFLLEKIWGEKRPEKRQVIVFKQSAIVSIVLSFVFGNLRGQKVFCRGGWVGKSRFRGGGL